MQRFAAALSATAQPSLVPPHALQSPTTRWKQTEARSSARRSSLSIRSSAPQQQHKWRGIHTSNASFPISRPFNCFQRDDRGGQLHGDCLRPAAGTVRALGRGAVSRGGPFEDHRRPCQDHQRRRRRTTWRQVADAIRDYAGDAWWPDDGEKGGDGSEAGEGGEESQLWSSRASLQLSLIGTLLGFPASTIDEWVVSHEARRRLHSSDAGDDPLAASISAPSSLSAALLNTAAEGESLEDAIDASLGGMGAKLSSLARYPRFLGECGAPMFPDPGKSSAAAGPGDDAGSWLCPRWMRRMGDTYGGSLMLLVGLGYLTQGFRCFPWFAVGYMLKDGLQVDPGYMQFLLSSAALPMVAKPIYGIISDSVYIRGAHRVPYLAISAILQVISWGALAWCPMATSSAVLLTAALTFGNLGAAISDVMNDALVAEVSKKQKSSVAQGELQSFVWLLMATGGLVGNLLGGFALKNLPLKTMFSVFIALQGLHLVACLLVNEASFGLAPSTAGQTVGDAREGHERKKGTKAATEKSVKGKKRKQGGGLLSRLEEQVRMLGQLLKRKEIWNTLMWFCASYAVVPVLGSSIFFYQTEALKIDPTFIGLSRMVGQVGLMVGSQLYGGMLKGLPLRQMLGSVQLLLSVCMLSDLVLVKRLNIRMGIPDEYYVLGASALVDCVSQFKVLPVIVRLGQLCPRGSEGSLMAFFSSLQCMAGLCSGYFGVALARYLRISSQSFEGLPIGILIQATFALLPILFIHLLPGEATVSKEVDKDEDKSL